MLNLTYLSSSRSNTIPTEFTQSSLNYNGANLWFGLADFVYIKSTPTGIIKHFVELHRTVVHCTARACSKVEKGYKEGGVL